MTLSSLLRPKCIAVIGVSRQPGKWGSRVLANTVSSGYSGHLYAVNPGFSLVHQNGITNVPNVRAIEERVDCAVIALPRERVPQAVRDCAERGVGAVVIVAAGFAELGGSGRDLQKEIQDASTQVGMRVLGPNCFGLFVADQRMNLTPRADIPIGDVALASQSGNLAIELWEMSKKRGIGFSYCIGVGNQFDVAFPELLEFFATDKQTRAVALYIESIPAQRGPSLVAALKACREARKPVIVLKAGRSRLGGQVARTHTAALTADDRVWTAVLKQQGAVVAESTEDVIDDLLGATRFPHHLGRVAVLTDGGGCSVLAVDGIEECGLKLARLQVDTQRSLDALIPEAAPKAAGRNPTTLDTAGGMDDDPSLLGQCAQIVGGDPGVDVIAVAGILGGYGGLQDREAETVRILLDLAKAGRPVAVQSAFPSSFACADLLRGGIPVFPTVHRMMRAIATMTTTRQSSASSESADVDEQPLSHAQLASLLAQYGIQLPSWAVAANSDELEAAIAGASWPVCLKLADPAITHKSEAGGVILNLANPARVREASSDLWALYPSSPLLLMPMLVPGFEALVGCFYDPVFGGTVVVGRGGIWTEVERDTVVITSASVNDPAAVENHLKDLRCYPMLSGGRGQPSLDMAAISELAKAMARLVEANHDITLEANPVFLYPTGYAIADLRGLRRQSLEPVALLPRRRASDEG